MLLISILRHSIFTKSLGRSCGYALLWCWSGSALSQCFGIGSTLRWCWSGSAFHHDANPDPAPHQTDANLQPRLHFVPLRLHYVSLRLHRVPLRLYCAPLRLHCVPLRLRCVRPGQLLNFDIYAHPGSESTIWLWYGSGFSLWCGSLRIRTHNAALGQHQIISGPKLKTF